jgi:23S rRNA (cytidine1920-2'-O)/16S rRNA (cytidine1409-2'-O)-methyltransferase
VDKKNWPRLDKILLDRGLAESREKAQALIMAGVVWVDGFRATKAGTKLSPEVSVTVERNVNPYVSRGGLKLSGALEAFGLVLSGQVVLDVGASTGGFTDCLLTAGARKVYALDVGYGQLAWKLRQDPRVVVIEKTNVRYYRGQGIDEPLDLVTIDVSFISLKLVIPAVLPLIKSGGSLLSLIKPQFEAGREEVGRGGVVRDPAVHRRVIAEIEGFTVQLGLTVEGCRESSLTGPEGNREFFLLNRVACR